MVSSIQVLTTLSVTDIRENIICRISSHEHMGKFKYVHTYDIQQTTTERNINISILMN